ncbi:hypothetical protein ACFWWM_43390 [Streptomyces sp. NPDC058682]|uniref:hypothetical protein n=1 Tax=Streptomyces sp. NPDC058682 TaxID=3346596 RepID=UPI0036566981
MNKTLDANTITSELEGSSFFPKKNSGSLDGLILQPKQGPPDRPNDRPTVREDSRRIITRNSFETYEDQMDSLREIAYLEKREGKVGSMSAMVREAIDDFLVKKKRTLNK